MATYISTFNVYASQVDWNESSLLVRFHAGLKDDILDSMAIAEHNLVNCKNGWLWLPVLMSGFGVGSKLVDQ